MKVGTCKACKYFVEYTRMDGDGQCHWLPEVVFKPPGSFCGQYKDNDDIATHKRRVADNVMCR